MEEHSKEEMETSEKNLEYPDISITNSWVVLSTKVSEEPEKKSELNLPDEKIEGNTEEHKAPFFDDVVQNISDTNNKSDAESDGISIISESEFYQSKSDDDYSTTSSEENDNFKNAELPKFQCEHVDQFLESHENSTGLEVISNHSSLMNKNDDMTQHSITDSNISNESNAEPDSDINNFEHTDYENKCKKTELINHFKKAFNYQCMSIICPLILAITVSYISSKFTQNSTLDQKNLQQNDQNTINNNEIVTIRVYEYCGDIYDCTSFNHDYKNEKCVKRPIKDLKNAKKLELEKSLNIQKSENFDLNDHNTEIFSSDKYEEMNGIKYKQQKIKKIYESKETDNDAKQKNEEHKHSQMTCKSRKEPRHYNRNLESFWRLEYNKDYQKKHLENTEKKLLNEKEKLDNWRASLAKEEKRLKEWENRLLKIEKKLYEKIKNKDISNANREQKNKPKKESKKTKHKEKKIDKFRADRAFENRKNFKTYRNGDKEINIPLKIERMKDKIYPPLFQNNEHTGRIPDIDDAKLKKYGDRYIQKRNQSTTFDDNNTITGEWYLNLLRGRIEKREKDEKAGWWFDRANFRKIKRNKAYWYFQYMSNRDNLRYNPKHL